MSNYDDSTSPRPGVIAYRMVPSDSKLIEYGPNDPLGSSGHFRDGTRFYPTKPTARSMRSGSASEGTTGETLTYDMRTKIPYPILWFATEGAKKAELGAPALTVKIGDKDLLNALKEPDKWEMFCPECKERTSLKTFLDTGKYNAIDFTELFCPHNGEVQMILKRI